MLAHTIADRINSTGQRDLTADEMQLVREMRYNRTGRFYALEDRTMLSVPEDGEAKGLGNGKKIILFPSTTVEQFDHHLASLRLSKAPREIIIDCYLSLRFARKNGLHGSRDLAGVYARSGIPRGE